VHNSTTSHSAMQSWWHDEHNEIATVLRKSNVLVQLIEVNIYAEDRSKYICSLIRHLVQFGSSTLSL
jgi:hypothetical protein